MNDSRQKYMTESSSAYQSARRHPHLYSGRSRSPGCLLDQSTWHAGLAPFSSSVKERRAAAGLASMISGTSPQGAADMYGGAKIGRGGVGTGRKTGHVKGRKEFFRTPRQ